MTSGHQEDLKTLTEAILNFASTNNQIVNAMLSTIDDRLTLEVLGISNLLSASSGAPHRGINRASPVSTECNIEDDLVIMERTCNIALVVVIENGRRCAPSVGIRVTAGDIIRDRTPREEPNLNCIFFPCMRVNTTSIQVKPVTISVIVFL